LGGDIHLITALPSLWPRLSPSDGPDERLWPSILTWLAGMVALAMFLSRAPLTWAAAVLAGVAFLVLVAIWPVVAVVVLAVALPFGDLLPLPLAGANVVDLLVLVALLAWLARGVARRQIVVRWPRLAIPILVLLWIMGLTLTQAISWRDGLPEWLKWAEFACLYLLASQTLAGRARWWVIGALFVAGMAEVALGAYQFIRQVGPEAFILNGRFMRAYGTFRQPNPYAGYLGYLAPVAASLAMAGLGCWWRERRRADLFIGLAGGGVTLALAAGIGMSWSRGAWLGLGAALLVVVAMRSRRTAALTGAGLLLVVFALSLFGTGWLPRSIVARLGDLGGLASDLDPAHTEITDANFAVLERLAHWQAGERMFYDHPWLGVGIGNYAAAYPAYAQPHWYDPLGHAHNVYLNFLAETGSLGLGAFVIFWLAAAWLAARVAWRRPPRPSGRVTDPSAYVPALAVGVLGTLTYCTVHNIFDNLFVAHMQLQLALLLAALAAKPGAV
jgi:putative inorganic carbon (hco3(-)) transporter